MQKHNSANKNLNKTNSVLYRASLGSTKFFLNKAVFGIKKYLSFGGKLIVLSSSDKKDEHGMYESFASQAEILAEALGLKLIRIDPSKLRLPDYKINYLYFIPADTDWQQIRTVCDHAQTGDVVILENLAFHKGEFTGGRELAVFLTSLGNAFVNDDFESLNKNYSSVVILSELISTKFGAGVTATLRSLAKLKNHPIRPVMFLIGGGSNLQSKLHSLAKIASFADVILLGGSIGVAFLNAKGYAMGKSDRFVGRDLELAKQILRNYKHKIRLPSDVVVRGSSGRSMAECVAVEKVKANQRVCDIGPKTIHDYANHLKQAQTIFWTGLLGQIETKAFSHGTAALVRLAVSRHKPGVKTVVAGKASAEFLQDLHLGNQVDQILPSSEALCSFIAGENLPGIKAISDVQL